MSELQISRMSTTSLAGVLLCLLFFQISRMMCRIGLNSSRRFGKFSWKGGVGGARVG
jgi:hypothetical protein